MAAEAVVVDVARRVGGSTVGWLDDLDDPPDGWSDPWLIGAAHEVLASDDERQARGAWYTPRSVVDLLADRALSRGALADLPGFVVDPTCGGGAFVLAALERLIGLGSSADDALGRVGGMDIDAGAVRATQLAVEAWGALAGAGRSAIDVAMSRIRLGDQLTGWPDEWPAVSVVMGNPPFATPLRGRSFPPVAQAAREERRDLLGPYADLAAIHLAVCVERVEPGGRVCLVLPQSILGGRDTAGLRSWIDEVAPMVDLWATKQAVFDASVRVWSPVVEKRSAAPSIRREPTGAIVGSWSQAAAFALGVPRTKMATTGTLDALLTSATAGFRDEFYALADACVELREVTQSREVPDGFLRLATVGSLDPLTSWWGRRETVFAKRRWVEPVVDFSKVEGRSRLWLEQMRVPKVLLPTQSRVFEPVVDRDGTVAPATPLLALHADPDAIDLVAAVLLAPPVAAWAFARWFGTAMSVEAIKIAARDLGGFPLPNGRSAWNDAAAVVAGADDCEPAAAVAAAIEAARIMHVAYGMDPTCEADTAVWEWWLARATALLPSTP